MEFDFVPESDTITFNYCFGSEEYLSYVNTRYNDVFGFFISGPGITGPYSSPPGFPNGSQNIAIVPNSNPALPITISSINPGINSQYYNSGNVTISYNGYTDVFTAMAIVQPCETYHIRLAIADGSDYYLDSGVLLEANSFSSTSVSVDTNNVTVTSDSLAVVCGSTINLQAGMNNPLYSILWNTGSTSSSIDVGPGQYYYTATNGNCVLNSDTVSVVQTLALDYTEQITNVSCNSGNNGSISGFVMGSSPPFNIQWQGPNGFTSSNSNINNLYSGTYNLQLTDALGCISNRSFFVSEPNPIILNVTSNNNNCINTSNGSITAIANGGMPPYQFSLNSTFTWQSSNIYNNLSSGSYLVDVLDSYGCTSSVSTNVGVNPPYTPNIFSVDASCGGGDGLAYVTLQAPTSGIYINGNYLWSNGQTNDTIYGLSQGTYSVSVIDPLGCSSNLSVNVNGSSTGMTVQELVSDVTCFGGADGSVTLNISGGVPPFSISAFGYNVLLPSGMNTFTTPVGVPAGVYPYDIIDAAQCTVSSVITVTQPAQITSTDIQSTCGLFNWNGNIYTSSGIYQYFMPNASVEGCDSTAILDLTVNPSSSGSSLISACDSYLWDGVVYTVNGIYANVYSNALGCDSIHSLNLTINNSNSGISVVDTCDSYSWNGINYTQSGIYSQILTNNVGCDSTHTLNLILNSSSNGVSNVTNCGSYLWDGLVYTTSGIYTNTYSNAVGCDSIHTLNLVINDIYNYNLIDTACGQYIFNSNTYDSSGIYIDTLTSTFGCDSIITLNLTIFQDSSVTYLTSCDSVEWGGVWYYSSDTVTITGLTTKNSFGGTNLNNLGNEGNIWYFGYNAGLDFNSGNPVSINNGQLNTLEGCASICDNNGDILFYTDGSDVYNRNNSLMPNGSGLLGNNSSTQSAIIVKKPNSSSNYYIFTADGVSGGSGGMHYSEVDMTLQSGFGDVVVANKNIPLLGQTCEKITAILHQNEVDFWIVSREENSNLYYSYLLTSSGVNPTPIVTSIGPIYNYTAGGYLKGSPDGNKLAAANRGSLSFINSIDIFDFDNSSGVISNISSISHSTGGCYGIEFSPNSNILYYTDHYNIFQVDLSVSPFIPLQISNLPTNTLHSFALQLGPDQKIYSCVAYGSTLDVIENPNIVGIGCNYFPNSVVLSSGSCALGLPTFFSSIFSQPSSGCDSVATAIITINNSTSNTTVVSACDNYQWTLNGINYLASGLYTEVSINSSGCTHTEILDLTINNSTFSNINVTECDSFLWIENGITYYSSGVYTHVTTNSAGCPNTATLNLTINNSSSTLTTVTACDSYVWSNTPNVNYTSSGIYISTYINPISGCLHTDSLDLTILNSSFVVDNVGSHCDSYTWIDGNTYTSSNNTATFVISNSVGCDSIISLDLIIYPNINVNASVTDELCFNYEDGRIDLTVSGGLGNFSFNWTGPNSFSSLNEDIYNLSPGYYAVSIIDLVTSCSISNSFLVDTGFNMLYSKSHYNISCYDFNDGLIDISPINLISPTYSWSDTLISIEDRSNLSSGVYTLRIDDNNCFSIDTFLINEPDSMFLIAQHPVASCTGSNNAQISLSVYGGVQNTSGLTYSYMWNNWNITPVNSNLSSGIYTVIVKDANNCELRDTFEILPYAVDIEAIVTNIDCFGNTNGSIDIEVLSGYPIFSYSWNNGSSTQDLYNISAGTYSCNIIDALGCIVDTTFEITEPNPLTAFPLLSNVTCYAGNDGSVSLAINGGTYPYNLDWGNIDTNYLFSGNYNYEIIDSNGCVVNGSVFIDQPDSLEVTFSVVDVICWGQPTGSINVQIALNSGTPPYSYSWSGPNFYSNNIDEDIDSLYAGTYSLTITDANGCTRFMEIVVDEPTAISQQVNLVPSIYSQYNIACKGENNGWIEAQISGGYLPFSFKWNTGETGDSIANLVAGTYTVDVTDGLGCTISYTVVLTEPEDSLVASITPFTNYNGYEVSCYFATDGGIGAQVNGGTGSYNYEWNLSNKNSDTVNDLSAGFHELIVYDSNNCFDVDSVTLYAPEMLVLDMNAFTDTCSKGVGGVDLNVVGGVPPYLYNWSAGQNTEDVYDLFSGINSVQVVDQNDCKITDTIIIANIFQPIADFKALPDHKRFYDQLNDPIVFVDMTQSYEQRVINWNWDFGDGFYGSDSITSHVYNEQGLFNVLLTITTEFNCIDTISYNVLIDEYELFIPNAFTPGISDNINSNFKAYGYGVKNFKMNIYTRWGERVFETEDFDTGWDGLHYLNGKECITGVYTYYIEVENIYGEVYKYENQVRLIR
ncbi:MAG: hypothetical protein CMP69_01460 [Flavobacteriales bacterium]|nr:hypothetical protein [Flavobacteriales bacterium]